MCVVSLSSPIPTFSLSLEWQPKDTSRNCFAVMYQPGTLYSSNPYMQSAKHDRKISNLEVFCLTRMRTDTSISRILWTLHHHGTWPVSVLSITTAPDLCRCYIQGDFLNEADTWIENMMVALDMASFQIERRSFWNSRIFN